MSKLYNHTLGILRNGQLAIGVGLRQARTVDIAKAMRTAGFDWLFIDMEHNSMSLDTAVQISVAAQDAGITPIVRVPGKEPYHATRALDGGAQGIIVPHVDTPEEAMAIVKHCRYPPMGHRSVTGAFPQLGFQSASIKEATEIINRETLIIAMIESPLGVENSKAIAGVSGIDGLLIGTNDLSMEMNIPGELGHPDIDSAYRKVVEASNHHGKFSGMGGVYTPDLMARYIELGVRLILAGNDLGFLLQRASQQASDVRNMLKTVT